MTVRIGGDFAGPAGAFHAPVIVELDAARRRRRIACDEFASDCGVEFEALRRLKAPVRHHPFAGTE